VQRGLEWAAGFVADTNNFDALATDYLLMLNELGQDRGHASIARRARELEKLAAQRLTQRLQRVFPANREGKLRYLAAARFLFRYGPDPSHLERYYRIALADIELDDANRFDQAAGSLDYSSMTDVLINAWQIHHLRHDLPDLPLQLPPDRLPRYLVRLRDIALVRDRHRAGQYSRQNYFVTHLVFVLSDFGATPPPDTTLSRRMHDYLLAAFDYVRNDADDNDLLAEFVHCLKIYGMDRDARVIEAQQYLLHQQNPDGSFFTADERGGNAYDLFHPTWTAITALNYSSNSRQIIVAR